MSGPSRRTRQRNQAALLARLERGRLVVRARMETRFSRRMAGRSVEDDGGHAPYFSLINRLGDSDSPPVDTVLDRSVVDLTCEADSIPGTGVRHQADDDDEIFIVSENIRTNSPVILDQIPAPVHNRGPSVIVANNFGRRDSPIRVLEEISTSISDQNVNPAIGPVASGTVNDDEAIVIQCPICFDSVKQMRTSDKATYVTNCGHVFCKPCIEEAIATSKSCPTCRKRLRAKDAHRVFL